MPWIAAFSRGPHGWTRRLIVSVISGSASCSSSRTSRQISCYQFTRDGMFLTFLSMSFVALALLAQGMSFGGDFLAVAAVVLAFDLVIGLATCGRIMGANADDWRAVHGIHAFATRTPRSPRSPGSTSPRRPTMTRHPSA